MSNGATKSVLVTDSAARKMLDDARGRNDRRLFNVATWNVPYEKGNESCENG